MQYETGEPHNDPTPYLLPSDGKPGPCWHHPTARAAAERFIEAAVARLARFDNILVWNVWQEIGFGDLRPGHLGVCYCPHTLAAYRDHLKTHYATLEELNAAWRSAFGDWEEVEPPRLFAAVPSWFDWRHFMDSVYLPWVLRWKGDAVRRADPVKRPILAHTGGASIATTVDWRWAEAVDLYGSSAYPSWGDLDEPGEPAEARRLEIHKRRYRQFWNGVLMKFDLIRAASRAEGPGGKFWTAELEGGRASGGLTPGRVPRPARHSPVDARHYRRGFEWHLLLESSLGAILERGLRLRLARSRRDHDGPRRGSRPDRQSAAEARAPVHGRSCASRRGRHRVRRAAASVLRRLRRGARCRARENDRRPVEGAV